MKQVSWNFAFRKLNEWREQRASVVFGVVEGFELEGNTTPVFAAETTRITDADPLTGTVTLERWNPFSLRGASFNYSDFEDTTISDLKPWPFESQLEAMFPDQDVLVFARTWEGR
jgi:hypothetical protein